MKYINEIWFLNLIKLSCYEEFRMTNLNDAKASNDLVLKGVSCVLRPFCTVKWVKDETN